ncbi:hypothetical protein [Actinomadura sp. SCN-SB]|uniref:hypothetical protein n=1 Tax=Actinomadura sp. SCN-SB TaxID=3373092 RepID=UPI003752EAB7
MPSRDTAEVIDQFDKAFVDHDPPDRHRLEPIQPAPEGERVEGQAACLAWWQTLAGPRHPVRARAVISPVTARPSAGDTVTAGKADYVRGVNLMRVVDGVIVEALGYGKTPAPEAVPLVTSTGD